MIGGNLPWDASALVSYLRNFTYLVAFYNEKVSIGLVIPSVLRFGFQTGVFSCRRTVPPLSVRNGSNLFLFGLPKDPKGKYSNVTYYHWRNGKARQKMKENQ